MEGRRKGTTGSSSERGSGSVVDWQRRKLRGITAQPAKVRSQNCPLGRCTLLLPIGKPAAGGLKHGGYYDCPSLLSRVTCHKSKLKSVLWYSALMKRLLLKITIQKFNRLFLAFFGKFCYSEAMRYYIALHYSLISLIYPFSFFDFYIT